MESTRGQVQVDFLKEVLSNGGRIIDIKFSLQRGMVRAAQPLFWITLEQNGVRSLQELAWTSELETYLLFELQQRMSKVEDEQQRFAAILLNNLRNAELHHGGKDFAQAVLVQLLRSRHIAGLQPLLDRAAVPHPSAESVHYAACAQFLNHSIDGLSSTAVAALRYSPEEASALMNEAFLLLLDETFHFSAADELFGRPQ
jgi:hypothetical protein